jgi:hypothetical protein
MGKNRYLVKPMMAILQFNIGHFFVSISLYNMLQNSIVCVSSSEAMKTANSREKWTS